MADDTVKSIPILVGSENFFKWTRAIEAYLLDQGALRVLKGFEPEPFRRPANLAVPNDIIASRLPSPYAGALPPGT